MGPARPAIFHGLIFAYVVEIALIVHSLALLVDADALACPIMLQQLPACCSPKPQPVTDECEWFTHVTSINELSPYAAQACSSSLRDLDRSTGP